jgi:hypothetical protein
VVRLGVLHGLHEFICRRTNALPPIVVGERVVAGLVRLVVGHVVDARNVARRADLWRAVLELRKISQNAVGSPQGRGSEPIAF